MTGWERACLGGARAICEHLASVLNAGFSIRLWDGSLVPLGNNVDKEYSVSFKSAGALGSFLRRPTMGHLLELCASGQIDFCADDLTEFARTVRASRLNKMVGKLNKVLILKNALPLLLTFADRPGAPGRQASGERGLIKRKRNNSALIQFHYDLSNDFYSLFLDPEMQYSCAYFTDWNNTVEQAQYDKLEMICRKLRLKPGEKLLDIGCGWGGLICHAARHYGVSAHGVTLSPKQYDYALRKISALGLEKLVTVELRDYLSLDGTYDKIASIGMYEHVGIANYETYFRKINSLLRDRGLLLNHGITRRAKISRRKFRKISAGNRMILKYIFPGSELDHIGHTAEMMEACGFEIHDIEGWREHYARTCKLWYQRLAARKVEAIGMVGEEQYRLWLLYLVGVPVSFADGNLRIYQTLASKHSSRGPSGMPPTRSDLYVV